MVRTLAPLTIALLFCFSLPCKATDSASSCDAIESEAYRHAIYPWQDATPLDYLTYIKFPPQSSVTVYGCKENWVKEADIPALLELLDSKESCPNQVSALSSFHDDRRSTVGVEAAWLIQAFRVGRFPPGLNSTRKAPDVEELRRWWKEREAQSVTQPPEPKQPGR